MFPFSHSNGNKPVLIASLKIISNDLQIVEPHIFSMGIVMSVSIVLGFKF